MTSKPKNKKKKKKKKKTYQREFDPVEATRTANMLDAPGAPMWSVMSYSKVELGRTMVGCRHVNEPMYGSVGLITHGLCGLPPPHKGEKK